MIKGIGMRLQRIGNLKIGKKGETRTNQSGREFRLPQKSDHFTVTTMELDENQDWIRDDEAMKALEEAGFTDKPKALPILLPFDAIDQNFFYELAEYTQSQGRVCYGDRETASRIDTGTGEETQVTCPCPRLESKHCKPRGILSVILPLSGRIGGVHQFRTTGWDSIQALASSMAVLKSMTGGPLAGIPLILTITPKKVKPKGGDKLVTIYVVSVEFRGKKGISIPAIEQLQTLAREQTQARLVGGGGKAIAGEAESLSDDMPEDVQDMNEEFKGAEEQQEDDQAKEPEEVEPEMDDFFVDPKPKSKPKVNPNDDPDIPF